MKIIAIANQKGGVGKTTTTVNLAAALVKAGRKVLCIDYDPQGNLSACLGYEPDGKATISELMLAEAAPSMLQGTPPQLADLIRHNSEGIDYLPSSILLSSADVFLATAMQREMILKRLLSAAVLADFYDFILIDCLPSLGVLLTNALAAADSVLIPVQAQKLALDGLELLRPVISQAQRTINPQLQIQGILVTMVSGTSMSQAVIEQLTSQYGPLVYGTGISSSTTASKSTNDQRSLVADAEKRHRGPNLGREYLEFTDEFLKREGC